MPLESGATSDEETSEQLVVPSLNTRTLSSLTTAITRCTTRCARQPTRARASRAASDAAVALPPTQPHQPRRAALSLRSEPPARTAGLSGCCESLSLSSALGPREEQGTGTAATGAVARVAPLRRAHSGARCRASHGECVGSRDSYAAVQPRARPLERQRDSHQPQGRRPLQHLKGLGLRQTSADVYRLVMLTYQCAPRSPGLSTPPGRLLLPHSAPSSLASASSGRQHPYTDCAILISRACAYRQEGPRSVARLFSPAPAFTTTDLSPPRPRPHPHPRLSPPPRPSDMQPSTGIGGGFRRAQFVQTNGPLEIKQAQLDDVKADGVSLSLLLSLPAQARH